jgi:hypothetical protein
MKKLLKAIPKKPTTSSFWADEWATYDTDSNSYYDADSGDFKTTVLTKAETSTISILRLAAHRRAIANFVNILTNKNIPVKFYKKGDSYTNGEYVVLSADVTPKKFDVAVGLALHEASHINLTDFNTFKNYHVPAHIFVSFSTKAVGIDQCWELIKGLTNWIEDRRIDTYIYNTCPGYRGYYRALYDTYFNDNLIDTALDSDEYTDESIDSYMFRIINFTNPNTKLNKLNGLSEIYKLIGLDRIDRLKSTADALRLAESIAEIIAENLPIPQQSSNSNSSKSGSNDSQQNQSNGDELNDGGDDDGDDIDSNASDDEQSPSVGGSVKNQPKMKGANSDDPTESDSKASGNTDDDGGNQSESSAGGNDTKKQLTDRQKQILKKKIQAQTDFLNDNIKKKSVSNSESRAIDTMEKSGTDLVTVGGEMESNGVRIAQTQIMTSRVMNEQLMQDSGFPFATWDRYNTRFIGYNEATLRKGLQMGAMLGKRLAIRSEERTTDNPRQKSGKIDRRLIAGLGYDYVNVFTTKDIDKFKKANLHISLDASGSMEGQSWDKSLTTTIAICKAASMLSNLDVQVSIRGTWGQKAYVCQAYDSRVDKFDKVKRLFPALHANGTTPEGLCYEAIMKQFIPANNDSDSYFLNICDGEPNFKDNNVDYNGHPALLHTNRMVKKIKNKGIKVMAYYISTYYASAWSENNFKTMYGEDSKFINVDDILQITKTLNTLFLQK